VRTIARGRVEVGTPAAASSPVARVRDLAVTFERGGLPLQALREVNLDIAPGEIVALVGESGSGKSVLGLSLLGLLPENPSPQVKGSVEVCGVDMLNARQDDILALRRLHLGGVFQDPMTSLNPMMRVGRQIGEVAGTVEESVRLLEAVGVPDARRRLRAYPHELSGGLRQRVMIAMAFAGEPKLVVADEPTTALDVTVQAQILRLVEGLRDETQCSFVFITHDLGVAAEVADRVAVLYAGRMVELGAAGDVLVRPSHPYAAALGDARLTLRTDRTSPVRTIGGEPPDPRRLPSGCAFAPRCQIAIEACTAAIPELREVAAHGGSVACLRPDEANRVDEPTVAWGPSEPVGNRLALEVVGVAKRFKIGRGRRSKQLHALRGVDLRVAGGEVVALVGESGSGKSTLLRVVAGLIEPDSGDIAQILGGFPGMVFQDAGASLTPWLSVGELLRERLRADGLDRGDARDRVAEVLESVGLPAELIDARPKELSGGQRQRVAIARAIVVPPPLLLCDEPTSALDASLAATTLNLLGRLRRELGMAMVFVTHDLGVARLIADRVAVMYLGRIVEDVPADRLADVRHPYARSLLAAVPGSGVERIALTGEPASAMDPPSGCAFHPRCDRAQPSCPSRAPEMVTIEKRHEVDCVLAGGA
jgi:peptide/nickel transport system ATP-binding protein